MQSAAQELIAPKAKTLAEAIFTRLRADVLLGCFPPGSRLRTDELRLRYGASGTVIREALLRLTSAGFAVAEGQRGFRVAETSDEKLLDLTKTRIWVEILTLRSAMAFGDRDWEAEVLAATHRLGPTQPWYQENSGDLLENWVTAHRTYHQTLVAGCRCPRLLAYRDQLHDLSDRYKRVAGIKSRSLRNLETEHQELTEAVLARDNERTVACIEDHFIATAAANLDEMGRAPAAIATLLDQMRTEVRAGMP